MVVGGSRQETLNLGFLITNQYSRLVSPSSGYIGDQNKAVNLLSYTGLL
ncbi:unnamed protein product [Schistosoma margrebowiei]|uniref:Uncharacterized protein n=1 Tax=Schistosoma margrebowiei TaxID=48269 RepID=A0A183MCT2_9TREM|nr:unnamed protein product [Schistosoma margrebowiei]